jgi:hypothetical protein
MLLLLALDAPVARAESGAETEARKCEERIAAAQRDALTKYETALQDLLATAQKAADLEAALTIRDEVRRVASEGALTDKHLVPSPSNLRTLQQQTLERLRDMVSHLVQEILPKLVEMKKSLTVAGRLDEALAVRGEIERLQNHYLPIVTANDSSVTTAETLLTAYAADRARADKIFKGQRIVVRGVVGGYRPDPADSRTFHLFLTGGAAGGWVQAFVGGDLLVREERSARSGSVLVIAPPQGDPVRVQKGQTFELRGVCEGFDETVRLVKCELLR